MTALHYGANQKAGLAAAGPTGQHTGPRGDAERHADDTTARAGKSIAPAGLFQIAGTGRVTRKKPLEVRERFRERKVGAVENIHSSLISASLTHPAAGVNVRQADKWAKLDVGGVCVKRIGTG